MNLNSSSYYKSIVFLILTLAVLLNTASAEEIQIEVKTKDSATAALGIFFDSQKIAQQPNTKIERLNEDFLILSIPYDRTKIELTSGFVSAYVLTDKNEIVFGTTKMLPPLGKSDSIWRLPTCPNSAVNPKAGIPIQEQLNYLESLFQIRLKKRELLAAEVKELLNPKTITALSTIETRFGLTHDQALNEETNPYLLNNRIRQIKDAILLYKVSKSEKD
jgi:hypothetical protein